jgi:hypothetical protein
MPPFVEVQTVDDAIDFSLQNPGRHFVMTSETLAQMEVAEAAGGFSAHGSGGADSSSEGDPAELDLDGALIIQDVWALTDGTIDAVLGIRDLIRGLSDEAEGPVILIPKREMDKFLYGGSDDDA